MKKQKGKCIYLRDLTREPPDSTTVKEPLSCEILLDRSAAYLARETARSSSVSNTLTFPLLFGVTISAIDALVVLLLNLEEFEFEFNLRDLEVVLTAKTREVKGGERVREESGRLRRDIDRAR